jgi:hypothetical protein
MSSVWPIGDTKVGRFAEKLPVTVRFASEAGTILRDLPGNYVPEARYAFYMQRFSRPSDRKHDQAGSLAGNPLQYST